MAFAAFPTTECGVIAGACLWYLLGGLIMGVTMTLLPPFPALSSKMRSFVRTAFLGELTACSTFSAETATLLRRREAVRTPDSVSNS